jgi:osmotically-inducible protein OsmY
VKAVLPFVLVAAGLLAGCEKTTTTTQTPAGPVTTTTVSPSAEASAVMGSVNRSLEKAAAAIQSSSAASQVLTRAGDAIEDGAVTAAVKAALIADREVQAMRIDVDTHGGVVTLKGSAATADTAERAGRIARETRGVKSVDNQLAVKPQS